MNIHGAFPSSYLKAADLQGRQVQVHIDRVEMEDLGGEHKPILYFQNKEKGLVLNKTNANAISDLYGDETGDWHGHPIVLVSTYTDFQGKRVQCIRVNPPQAQASAPAPANGARKRSFTAAEADTRVSTVPPQPEFNPEAEPDDGVPF